MMPEKSQKIDLEHFISFLKAAQKAAIHIRLYPHQNDTIDITTLSDNDDVDRPDPLRLPEVLIVISVLLLWCGSIFIFIRHSELLRIRHRDLPFRSPLKLSMNLNHITIANRTSDMIIHSKSGVSSISGLTPPISNRMSHGYRHDETIEARSLTVSPVSRQRRRHTHSYDLNTPSSTKYSSDKSNKQEHLLHPHRISSEIKQSLLDLHRKSVDNLQRKSADNGTMIKYSTFYSTNDMSRREQSDTHHFIGRKRYIQESPV